jgi:nucleoside-diphosphate-sugar epimerase
MAPGKVTVFGGTGFLGQRVVQRLLERDFVRASSRAGVVTLPFEERERSTPYGSLSRRDGLTPRGHRRGA